MVSQKPKYCKRFERNSHWRKLSMIIVWERYCYASPKPEFFFIFFVYISIHISANMIPFGLKFSQMILHTETSKLMYNWYFLFVVLHKPTLLPSTFKRLIIITQWGHWIILSTCISLQVQVGFKIYRESYSQYINVSKAMFKYGCVLRECQYNQYTMAQGDLVPEMKNSTPPPKKMI